MSKTLLKLLLVEDSEDDAMLLLRELNKGDFKVEWKRVDNAADLQLGLSSNNWDLVITDHNMPGFDSSAAIQIIKKSGIDIPIIIVSGSIGEDIAVESMKSGAHDYILKNNIARLVPAISRELGEAKSRKARREAEEAIRHMAYHDSLTGLMNRHKFEQQLAHLYKSSQNDGSVHSLLYLDLDQFKIVNDTSGHIAGDDLLKKLSVLMESKIRGNDIIARLGGDEFGILLENCPLDKAKVIANEFCDLIGDFRFHWKQKEFNLGVSIGLVAIDKYSEDISSLLSCADLACYAAKDQGRNCTQVYQEATDEFTKRRGEMDWTGKIDQALKHNQFLLFRQSIVPLQSKCNGQEHFEILVRMQGDNGKIIYPDSFIPAAERYNRMRDIDHWVIHAAFEYLAAHKNKKLLFISINLSGQSLGDESLFEFVSQHLKASSAPAETICFEITETAAIENFDIAIKFIQRMKLLGCKFALDDFGSGLSSFAYLKSLPVDYLKIDGSFVKNIINDPMDKTIVEAINSVAHKAGMKTIAEYVESIEIQQCLREMGVDYAQGYAIDKPHSLPKN
ncbi:MAG: EAL domain-containing protein [Methylococcales bacterium]